MGRGSAVSPWEPHGVVTVTRAHLRVWREESEASLGISHEETRSDVAIASLSSFSSTREHLWTTYCAPVGRAVSWPSPAPGRGQVTGLVHCNTRTPWVTPWQGNRHQHVGMQPRACTGRAPGTHSQSQTGVESHSEWLTANPTSVSSPCLEDTLGFPQHVL